MATFEVPGSGGQFFAKSTTGEPIVWLPNSVQLTLDFNAPAGGGTDKRNVVGFKPTLTVSVIERNPHKLRFSIKASAADTYYVQGEDAQGRQTKIIVVAGDFKNHPEMDIDLLADLCRSGDALKLLRVQQLLYDQDENIFNQNSKANLRKFGSMMCGAVAKGRAIELFGDVNVLDYTHAYHEPLAAGPVSSRFDVKYRSDVITKVRQKIVSLLTKSMPVRVGVLDSPVGMMPHDHKLIAWDAGGHTVVIVGCDKNGMNFMYVDPWFGGSKMTYEGGLMQPIECNSMAIFNAQMHGERKVEDDPLSVPNLLVQRWDTYGTFSWARGNYLEVVAGPSI
jgi:Papain-like cysteine protease AvrRpt2